MDLGAVRQIDIGLQITLITIFLFDDVVPRDEAEPAQRAVIDPANGRATGVAAVTGGLRLDRAIVEIRCGKQARRGQRRPARRVDGIGGTAEFAGIVRQRRAVLPAEAGHQVDLAEGLADQDRAGPVVLGTFDRIQVALNDDTVEVPAGDEVGDAGDGIGTISGGRAILQHFDVLQGKDRNEVGIDEAIARRQYGAAAVEQHQRAGGAKAAQVQRAIALEALRCGGILVGITQRGAHRRQLLDEFQR